MNTTNGMRSRSGTSTPAIGVGPQAPVLPLRMVVSSSPCAFGSLA